MAGRTTDPGQSTTDKDFATNIGIAFKTPEEMFGCVWGVGLASNPTNTGTMFKMPNKTFGWVGVPGVGGS